MDAALRAHKFNPALRVVVRMFNTSLGEGLAQLPYCTVLSDTEIAAGRVEPELLPSDRVAADVVLARGRARARFRGSRVPRLR